MNIIQRFATEDYVATALDEKLLLPSTASVGQTIVVKAIDENGKPTEWEAVDLPSGDGNALYYSEETNVSGIAVVTIQKGEVAGEWLSLSGMPHVGDLVISATGQLFKISEVSEDSLYMGYIMDLKSTIDATLTQEGQAADAKAVGDAIANVGTPTDEQVNAAVSDYLAENPVQPGTNIYIGPNQPTNGAEYWLDTSDDETQIVIYTVETTLTNASIDNTATEVSEGDAYVANIYANDGYTLTGADIGVAMGGVDVTSSAYSNGKISIANVTGNISITVSAVVIADDTVTYTITNTLTNVTTNNPVSSVEENSSYTATLTAVDGYELDTVSVTMGSTDVTSTVYVDGVISISAVTGDVVITASAVSTGDGPYIYKLADISAETTEGRRADGVQIDTYTRYKIKNIKTGDIVYLASNNADNTIAWYDDTTGYGFNNTDMFTAKFQDNYAWKQYSWTADKDYDYLYFASKTSLLESYPNAYAYIVKSEKHVDTGDEDTGETTVTLSSISAAYSGGDVAVGTAVTDLTDIVVTATYSDGSTAIVTNYTLSGEIVEGENTVTVTYEGMTTTFTITGIAESTGENIDITTFVLNVPYLVDAKTVDNDWNGCEYNFETATNKHNVASVCASAYANKTPITDYFNSTYDDLYAVTYFPNRSDGYGSLTKWSINIYSSDAFGQSVADLSITNAWTSDYKCASYKLSKADVISAIDATEYTQNDIIEIRAALASSHTKNTGLKTVWMATEPTTEQLEAIRDFFANGGEL